MKAVICPTWGWALRNDDALDPDSLPPKSLGQMFRIDQGLDIGNRARSLYAGGLLIREKDMERAAVATQQALDNPNISTVFEGAFLVDGTAARADVLTRDGAGWHLLEVKSSANDRSEYVDDLAYTAMVLSQAGLEVTRASLLLISKDFRLGMDNQQLFVEVDHTDDVLVRAVGLRQIWPNVLEESSRPEKPAEALKYECRRCELFLQCTGKNIENHIFDIPRLSLKKFTQLTESGIVRIEDIPTDFPLTDRQSLIREAVQAQAPIVRADLEFELARVSWPAHYLDFESVTTAIPLYPGIAPHNQIPTQYSAHCCQGIGEVTSHSQYLSDHTKDSRLELARQLIEDLPGNGSIIVYSNFEKTMINGLATEFPSLAPSLTSLVERIVDLQEIITKNFYHPNFGGSVSLKNTVPALAPDMSYAHLSIGEGETAMATYAYLAMGRYDGESAEAERQNLLRYCKQDTLAMVKLHQRLDEFLR